MNIKEKMGDTVYLKVGGKNECTIALEHPCKLVKWTLDLPNFSFCHMEILVFYVTN